MSQHIINRISTNQLGLERYFLQNKNINMWDISNIFHEKVKKGKLSNKVLRERMLFSLVLFLMWFYLSFSTARRTIVCSALFECCATGSIFYSCWPKRNCTRIGWRGTSTNVWEWKWCWIVSKKKNNKNFIGHVNQKLFFWILEKTTKDFCNNHREMLMIRDSFL